VVTGRLLDGNGGGTAKQAELVSAQGYEPFGSLLPGRNYSSDSYRFGFGGMPKDDELHGATGTSYDFGARLLDPRIGRWMSVDPAFSQQPGVSPYQSFLNSPLQYVDPEGETEFHFTIIRNKDTGKTTTVLKVTPDRYIQKYSRTESFLGMSVVKRQVYDVVIKEEIVIENGTVQSKTKTKSEGKLRATLYFDDYYTFYVQWLDLEMPGGLYLVGEGGASPTEYHALSDADLVEVDDLITAFGAMGTGASLGSDLADKIKLVADLTEELAGDGDSPPSAGGTPASVQDRSPNDSINITYFKDTIEKSLDGRSWGGSVMKRDTKGLPADTAGGMYKGNPKTRIAK
jgi:RHS repeat-associated protein